ncbi:MAG TPA: adenylate/guanylate cyclase domain-containing protein [Stellaceae bacterium]
MNVGRGQRAERRLAAILAADVAGYSRLMGADEEGTLAALKEIRAELGDPKIAEHRGRIVKTTGDGMLVEFASVVDAVRFAVEVQRAMAERNADVEPHRRLEFRIGINLGDIISDDNDIYGDGVNVAARLEALAEPGGICVSGTVHDHVRDKLDVAFDDMGEQQVKNIARPVHVYRIHIDAGIAPAKAPLALPDKPSLAVLPFQNMSGDAEQEYFADGIVEDITTAVARLPWLFVIARNSSFTYKGRAVDVKQVGRELGVRYVLEGSVRKAANRVRITGQLIDTMTGSHIWADRFDGALDDIFELQDQVASSVAGAIEPKLRGAEIERAARKPTESLDAYDFYLRGLALAHKWMLDTNNEAIRLLRSALAIDPAYAPAAALIGWCRMVHSNQDWGPFAPGEIAEALDLARRVIETGKEDPDALWMAGYSLVYFGGDHATGLRVIERSLMLNPNSALAWSASGWANVHWGRHGPACEGFMRALRLSPVDPVAHLFKGGLALAHMAAGRFDEAMEWVDQALSEQPRLVFATRIKLTLCGHLGRSAEAREFLGRLLELQPGLTIARYRAFAAPFVAPATIAIYAEGLRKAGLPEE